MGSYANPEAYEVWMARWSARLAPLFIRFAGPAAPRRLLDVGAGTGVLARALLAEFADAQVVGIEPAASYVEHARRQLPDRRVRFQAGDAESIPFDDGTFDAALSLLVLQELPDPGKAVAEMRRVTRRGGVVCASQWDFRDGMPMLALFWESVEETLPSETARREAGQPASGGPLEEADLGPLWTGAGLADVRIEALRITLNFASFDDYWRPFLGNATRTSSYAGALPEPVRQEVARRLREKVLPSGADRPFALPARAWAVRGVVP